MLNRHRRKRVLNFRHWAVGSYISAASARESCGPQRRENWSLRVYVTHGRLKRGWASYAERGDVCRATGPLSLILATMRPSRSALADVSR
jgi:hypothetical protein